MKEKYGGASLWPSVLVLHALDFKRPPMLCAGLDTSQFPYDSEAGNQQAPVPQEEPAEPAEEQGARRCSVM